MHQWWSSGCTLLQFNTHTHTHTRTHTQAWRSSGGILLQPHLTRLRTQPWTPPGDKAVGSIPVPKAWVT